MISFKNRINLEIVYLMFVFMREGDGAKGIDMELPSRGLFFT